MNPRLIGCGYSHPTIQPEWKWFEYPFVKSDAGRTQSRRPKQKNDCTVRALALAMGTDYDDAYDILADWGRECSRGFRMQDFLEDHQDFEKVSFPAKKGQLRMNPATFSKTYNEGRYIIKTAKHVSVFIDGVLYDTQEENPMRCIYTAWRYKP